MNTTSTVKLLNLPWLKDDGSNWILYKERIPNAATSKGLKRHLTGTAKKPAKLTENNGDYYKPGELTPLSDDELKKHLKLQDEYDQKEALMREIFYETVSNSTFMQIKNQPSAAHVWGALVAIFETKGDLVQQDLISQLQNARCPEDSDIRAHLANMQRMGEELARMGTVITDQSFCTYIRQSLPPNYRPVLKTLSVASKMASKPVTSAVLIQEILEAADEMRVEKNIDEGVQNSALAASARATKDKGKGKGKGKGRDLKDKKKKHCTNCGMDNHVVDDCYCEGGGKEGQAPWDQKKKNGDSANVAGQSSSSEVKSYGFATIIDDENVELIATTDCQAQAEALAASGIPYDGELIDMGASCHFSPA
ncbi:hypothetical protein ARMSODRAFT_899028 [Armillaria solidipes]|uniref:CCHC-type domain-containing protein n=1 Tax=Armillaria solidipes TaxID=1076256 RepID=A0A2H3AL67_9AGAR|nr:hypothetical protein ARMSODRAFT_899028 [Armillaria solidipes]